MFDPKNKTKKIKKNETAGRVVLAAQPYGIWKSSNNDSEVIFPCENGAEILDFEITKYRNIIGSTKKKEIIPASAELIIEYLILLPLMQSLYNSTIKIIITNDITLKRCEYKINANKRAVFNTRRL